MPIGKHRPIPFEQSGGCRKDVPKMRGHRHGTSDGTLEEKKGTARTDTLERVDHVSISDHVPPDTRLRDLRKITGKRGVHKVAEETVRMEKEGTLDSALRSVDVKPAKI